MGNGQDWGETGRARGYKVSRTPKAQRFPSQWRFRRRQYLWSCRICGKSL